MSADSDMACPDRGVFLNQLCTNVTEPMMQCGTTTYCGGSEVPYDCCDEGMNCVGGECRDCELPQDAISTACNPGDDKLCGTIALKDSCNQNLMYDCTCDDGEVCIGNQEVPGGFECIECMPDAGRVSMECSNQGIECGGSVTMMICDEQRTVACPNTCGAGQVCCSSLCEDAQGCTTLGFAGCVSWMSCNRCNGECERD